MSRRLMFLRPGATGWRGESIVRRTDALPAGGFHALQQPAHVLAERQHGLQPLAVAPHIIGSEAVYRVPVLRRDDGHVGYGKNWLSCSNVAEAPLRRHDTTEALSLPAI